MLRTFVQGIAAICPQLTDKCPQYCGRILTVYNIYYARIIILKYNCFSRSFRLSLFYVVFGFVTHNLHPIVFAF